MNILLIAATEAEIAPLIEYMRAGKYEVAPHIFEVNGERIHICITGVGMVATTYALAKALSAGDTFHFALQAGIGGAFDRQIALGDVVFITADEFADLGAEDHDQYLDIYQMGLAGKNDFPFRDGKLYTPLAAVHQSIALPQVSALTVNMVTGNEASVARLMAKYGAAVESMEGAAFHYVCLQENIPFAQVRAISNYVEPRDKSKWKMKEAVIALNKWLISYFQQKVINI